MTFYDNGETGEKNCWITSKIIPIHCVKLCLAIISGWVIRAMPFKMSLWGGKGHFLIGKLTTSDHELNFKSNFQSRCAFYNYIFIHHSLLYNAVVRLKMSITGICGAMKTECPLVSDCFRLFPLVSACFSLLIEWSPLISWIILYTLWQWILWNKYNLLRISMTKERKWCNYWIKMQCLLTFQPIFNFHILRIIGLKSVSPRPNVIIASFQKSFFVLGCTLCVTCDFEITLNDNNHDKIDCSFYKRWKSDGKAFAYIWI